MEPTRMLKRNPTAPVKEMPVGKNPTKKMESLMADLLESVTVVHKAHLKITGEGSFAAHKAMGEFYEEIGGLADKVAEGYQGATESLLEIGQGEIVTCKSTKDCVALMNSLYQKVNDVQSTCGHSEIINDLDNIKSLINSTKYKLLFLK